MLLEFVCLITLFIAAVSDIKTREVDPLIFLVGGATEFTYVILKGEDVLMISSQERFLATMGILCILGAFGVLSRLGGADVFAGMLCALTVGYYSLYVLLVACIATVPFLLYRSKKGKGSDHYPFVPFIFGAYVFMLPFIFKCGGII